MMAMPIRRKWLIVAALAFLGVFVLCGIGLGVIVLGFECAPPPPPACPMDTLLIDQTVIPEPLIELGRDEPADRYGVEFEEIRFFHPLEEYGGDIRQTVYRGLNEQQAARGYRDFVDSYFYPGSYFFCRDEGAVWELPPEMTFESSIADEWRLGCTAGCSTEPQYCQYIGRYGVYFVWYYAWMSDVVTYAEFENILEDIDGRMAQCVEQAK